MGTVPTEHTDGKDPMTTTTPAASAAATESETTGATVLGSLQLNTSNGKVFVTALTPAGAPLANTSFEMIDLQAELPYVEVSFTAAGLTEHDEAFLVAFDYGPVMGLVRGVLATVIAPAPAADAAGFLFVDFESTGLPFNAGASRTRTSCRCRSPPPWWTPG